jgi:hypothetical protein
MIGFIRPEARAQIWRWRESLAGFGLAILGIWLVLGPGSLAGLVGYALGVAGFALIWVGWQRARFRKADDGPGAVQVDEGKVTYFGPLTGGSVAMRELDSLTLNGAMFPAHWQLEQPGAPPLLIPVNAAGADALFDVFATLPGLKTERMLTLLRDNPHQAVVIWQRGQTPSGRVLIH